MAQSKGKGNVLTDKDMTEEERHALGKTGAGLLESKFMPLPRNVQKACNDDAFRRAVQTELGLKKQPASTLLATAIKLYRAQPAAKPAKRARRAPRAPEDPVKMKCEAAASKVVFDAATGATTIQNVKVVAAALRAVGARLLDEKLLVAQDLVDALPRVALPEGEKRPAHLGELFTKVAAMSDAERRAVVERTKAAERARRGVAPPPPSTREAPLSTRSNPAPAESAPLATTEAPKPYDQFRDYVEMAKQALSGDKVVKVGRGISKEVEMRRVGDAEWQIFASQSDAARAFPGVSSQDVSRLCNDEASPERLKFEARPLVEFVSRSERQTNALVLRAGGFCFSSDVGSAADALSVSLRGAWEVADLPPPESWEDALGCFGEFSEEIWRKFVAATGEAEAARVRLMHTATLTGTARVELNAKRAKDSAANARAEIEAMKDMIARGYFNEDTGDLIVGLRADDRDVKVSFLDPNAPMDDGPVMIEVRGQEVELKGGPPPLRLAVGSGNLILAKRDKPVATLRRPRSNVVTWLTADFARGDTNYTHGGEGGPWAATITAHQKPGAYVRGLPFNPYDSLRDVGFHVVDGTRTAATTYDGAVIEGAGTLELELHLFGSTDLMPAFAAEMDRFSEALKATSRDEPRLCEGVAANYRRDGQGTGRSPALLFAQPNRARGIPPRAGRGLAFLRTNDYPIMYEVARRCNWYCVRFELVAYRELVPVRLRLHVDSMAELSISKGGMMSAALATA